MSKQSIINLTRNEVFVHSLAYSMPTCTLYELGLALCLCDLCEPMAAQRHSRALLSTPLLRCWRSGYRRCHRGLGERDAGLICCEARYPDVVVSFCRAKDKSVLSVEWAVR